MRRNVNDMWWVIQIISHQTNVLRQSRHWQTQHLLNLLAEIREQEVLARFVRTQADTEYFSRKFIDKLLYISNVFEARISCSLTKQWHSFGINNPGSHRITQITIKWAPGNRYRDSAPLRTLGRNENQAPKYPEENRRLQLHSFSRSPTPPRCATRDFFSLSPNSSQSNHGIFRIPCPTHTNMQLMESYRIVLASDMVENPHTSSRRSQFFLGIWNHHRRN